MRHLSSTLSTIERVLDRPVRATVSCSFQAGGVALVHMLRRYQPDIPLLFVDTGYHFPETLEFRDRLTHQWDLNLQVLTARRSVEDQEAQLGLLNRTDPSRCCALRKVEPLYRALASFDLWLTGIRREQSPTRSTARDIERKLLPAGHVVDKANPLLAWSWDDILAYHRHHGIPLHPLHERGYPSIGCAPCTAPAPLDDARAGRWNGDRLECGLHTVAQEVS